MKTKIIFEIIVTSHPTIVIILLALLWNVIGFAKLWNMKTKVEETKIGIGL